MTNSAHLDAFTSTCPAKGLFTKGEPAPDSAPSLHRLTADAAVVPIDVVQRPEYGEALPSLGDFVTTLPQSADELDDEGVPTVRMPRRSARGHGMLIMAVAVLSLVLGGSAAWAAWFATPALDEGPTVPAERAHSLSRVDTEALSLAVANEALANIASRDEPVVGSSRPTTPARATESSTALRSPVAAAAPLAPFDPTAASSALDQAAASAGACRGSDDPSGVARVIVTFAPSGRVTSATVNGAPFAGTTTGGCIAHTLRAARVPPFSGSHTTVAKTVSIY